MIFWIETLIFFYYKSLDPVEMIAEQLVRLNNTLGEKCLFFPNIVT